MSESYLASAALVAGALARSSRGSVAGLGLGWGSGSGAGWSRWSGSSTALVTAGSSSGSRGSALFSVRLLTTDLAAEVRRAGKSAPEIK